MSKPPAAAAARMAAGSGAASAVGPLLLMRLMEDANRRTNALAEFCFEGGSRLMLCVGKKGPPPADADAASPCSALEVVVVNAYGPATAVTVATA